MDTTGMKNWDEMELEFLRSLPDDLGAPWQDGSDDYELTDRILGIRLTGAVKEVSDRSEDYTMRESFTIDEGSCITLMLQSGRDEAEVLAMWQQAHEVTLETGGETFVLGGRFTCRPVDGCGWLVTGRIRWTDMAGVDLCGVRFHVYMGEDRMDFTCARTFSFLPARLGAKIEPLELYLTTDCGNTDAYTRHGFGPDEQDFAYVWFVCKDNLPSEVTDNLLLEAEFEIRDDSGTLKKHGVSQAFMPDDGKVVANLHFNMIGWADGFYHVYVKVWGQPVCHAIFGIGKRLVGKSIMMTASRKKGKAATRQGAPAIKAIEQIHKMIGLDQVKKHLQENICYVQMMEARKQANLPCGNRLMHVVMTGSPGTGKTTVARLLGTAYKEMNILSSGHTVECNRATLVQDHIGGTEKATLEKIEEAKGGVLFIDEAYALFSKRESSNDFGLRIIDSLMTVLSDPESDILVVLAGYADEMDSLLAANPGLKSRFPVHLHFPDYSVDELMLMTESWLSEHRYKADAKVMQRIRDVFGCVIDQKGFGAGRFVHTFIENTVLPNMATRLFGRAGAGQYDKAALTRILSGDIPKPDEILARIKGPEKKVRAIGFR